MKKRLLCLGLLAAVFQLFATGVSPGRPLAGEPPAAAAVPPVYPECHPRCTRSRAAARCSARPAGPVVTNRRVTGATGTCSRRSGELRRRARRRGSDHAPAGGYPSIGYPKPIVPGGRRVVPEYELPSPMPVPKANGRVTDRDLTAPLSLHARGALRLLFRRTAAQVQRLQREQFFPRQRRRAEARPRTRSRRAARGRLPARAGTLRNAVRVHLHARPADPLADREPVQPLIDARRSQFVKRAIRASRRAAARSAERKPAPEARPRSPRRAAPPPVLAPRSRRTCPRRGAGSRWRRRAPSRSPARREGPCSCPARDSPSRR